MISKTIKERFLMHVLKIKPAFAYGTALGGSVSFLPVAAPLAADVIYCHKNQKLLLLLQNK